MTESLPFSFQGITLSETIMFNSNDLAIRIAKSRMITGLPFLILSR